VVLLVLAMAASACGSSVVAVRVGDSALDRDGVATLVAEVTGRSSDATIDATTTAAVVDRFVQYESLVDLLASYDVVATPEERSTARDRLLAAGMDPGDLSLPRLIGWQAALDLVEAGGVDLQVRVEYLPLGLQSRRCEFSFVDREPVSGCSPYYVRLTQVDGGRAWTSPFYVHCP